MNVYIGQTRAAGWIRLLESYGFGEMCVREEVPPRRQPWAFDNGAFKDFSAGKPFNLKKYEAALDYVWLHAKTKALVDRQRLKARFRRRHPHGRLGALVAKVRLRRAKPRSSPD